MEGCITTKCKIGLSFGIILLFVLSAVAPMTTGLIVRTSIIRNDGNILYVGGSGEGNYSKIQDAIDNASDGDTVFVYDDSSPYNEWNITIDKSINLIGENRDTTVIDGNDNDIIEIDYDVNGINISGFTFRNKFWGKGISTHFRASNIIISDNHFVRSWYAINFIGVEYGYIISNIFSDCGFSIYLEECNFNKVANNIIIYNYIKIYDNPEVDWPFYAIRCEGGDKHIITNNTCIDNDKECYIGGLKLEETTVNCIIEDNVFNGFDEIGMCRHSRNNLFSHNTFINNDFGISMGYGAIFNSVLNNNFINNKLDACSNIFLNKFDCNYWDKWIGFKIPKLSFLPYFKFSVFGSVVDWHPAKQPYNYTTTQGCGIE